MSGNNSEDFWVQNMNAGKGQVFLRSTTETEDTAIFGHLDPVKARFILQYQGDHGTGTFVLKANLPEINGTQNITIYNHKRPFIPEIGDIAYSPPCAQEYFFHLYMHRNGKIRPLNRINKFITEMMGIYNYFLSTGSAEIF